MIRAIVDSRFYLSMILSVGTGVTLNRRFSFPAGNAILQLILGIKYCYETMLFSTPFIICSMLFSLLYIFVVKPRETVSLQPLPPYPKLVARERLFLVVGELHHPKRPEPVEQPLWLTIPDRGLYTGIAIFGAIGSGKTSCSCIHLPSKHWLTKLATPKNVPLAWCSKSKATSAIRCARS